MTGHRLPDGWDDGIPKAGAFYRDPQGTWTARTPNGLMANLKNHTVVEHEDRLISVTPSILVTGYDRKWHGFLTKGIWTEC
jgi:hypothetical protein